MISATIISLNEEDKIQNAINSLDGLVDEVIVVDGGSNDKTAQIAKKLGARVYFRKFDNFANQKNWAVSQASFEWILSLDADEEIPGELAQEIKRAINNNKYQGFLIPRRNFILGKEIKHSRWSPDRHIWLWKKSCGSWKGEVHEEVVVSGIVGILKNSKIHLSHKNVSDFFRANNLYSALESRATFNKNIKFSLWKTLSEPFWEFFLRYFLKSGFLDGKEGFILSYLMGIYRLTFWIKLWELEQK